MRLARPIYSKTGVLLFDSNSDLTSQAIDSVKNFGLLGVYVLEPAEPALVMSEEDREFERFQTVTVFAIQEEIEKILTTGKQQKMHMIAESIIKNFGLQNSNKVNFYQNLRSKDDYVYRHSMNVAILCAMISRGLNMRREEQHQIIYAALVHDIAKFSLAGELVYGSDLTVEQKMRVFSVLLDSGELIERAFGDGLTIKRICSQMIMAQMDELKPVEERHNMKFVRGARILLVANRYDEMTGMTLEGTANSEVKALKELLGNPGLYEPEIVEALMASVRILSPGVSVELNTGEKALVLAENPRDILRPTVLCFKSNQIIDLSLRVNEDFEVVDVMKTLDNRCVMDTTALREAGF